MPDRSSDGAALVLLSIGKSFVLEDGRSFEALHDVSLSVTSRSICGLIGPDGAGKTTLMRLVAGLLAPERGEIRLFSADVVHDTERAQRLIGYMPQRFGLYEDLSVRENMALYAELQGVPPELRRRRFDELLGMSGLGPYQGRLAGRLSGGMKQKLGLICTLLRRPRLLLLDEPTVGVDPVSRHELWQIVGDRVDEEGMTVLLSTAYLDEAERCDSVVLMHEGRVLEQAPPERFSQALSGRVFTVSAPAQSARRLQARLAACPEVADALLTGKAVRVVLREGGSAPAAEALGLDDEGIDIHPVAPRFEDAFVDRLRSDGPSIDGDGGVDTGEETSGPVRAGDDAVIEVVDLERRFGDFVAVKGLDFKVHRGEIFGLLGANGAGRSTTFRMLCGLLPPSGGRAMVAGHDLRHAPALARRRIGYMAQRFSLYVNMSVMQNLRFFASVYGLRGRRLRERIDWALENFALRGFATQAAGKLSLGHRQRLAFAAALMHEPEVLFLDEPTSGVDPLARREFWRRTNALAAAGVTVLVTTHFMEEANFCDRLVIMAEGEILAQGAPDELRASVRDSDRPEPTMEEAFISLLERRGTGP